MTNCERTESFEIKASSLKCYRKTRCQALTLGHKKAKVQNLNDSFWTDNSWKNIWFSDKASFHLQALLSTQNERKYEVVKVKTEIRPEDMIVEIDKWQTSLMCYVPYLGMGKQMVQKNFQHIKERKQLTKSSITRKFASSQIKSIMGNRHWIWQQGVAKAHTTGEQFLD